MEAESEVALLDVTGSSKSCGTTAPPSSSVGSMLRSTVTVCAAPVLRRHSNSAQTHQPKQRQQPGWQIFGLGGRAWIEYHDGGVAGRAEGI